MIGLCRTVGHLEWIVGGEQNASPASLLWTPFGMGWNSLLQKELGGHRSCLGSLLFLACCFCVSSTRSACVRPFLGRGWSQFLEGVREGHARPGRSVPSRPWLWLPSVWPQKQTCAHTHTTNTMAVIGKLP